MTQEEIIELFRQKANTLEYEAQSSMFQHTILELAQLLAESRGRLSKENFETLLRIGGVLYKEGNSQFQARSDVHKIMQDSKK
ncbi:hypothetical protein [Noviherbaspirillum galbum]|uniref:Uncharacterized protein n=1 Tax=Noviherbaspirillum galbum TaxID=2709383 RepID=A0A6B3SSJ2_9BURK|nr:hypothetical protein [Noviherbaspirillum galbum]NEX61796.1 hypothetical protein [Noviherbaspirillum galbum]